MYQVGPMDYYADSDPWFDTIDDAREYIEREFTKYYERPIGIWGEQEKNSPLLEIFMQGEYFVKE